MADFVNLSGWLLVAVQTALFVVSAPLLAGWVKRVKCVLQNRRGPSLLQPYRDLARLFAKESVDPDTASPVFHAAPYVAFAATALAASVIPFFAAGLPSAAAADMIVLVGFLALARVLLALAAMDAATPFGGMGASREMTLSSLAEPAMLMAIFTLSLSVDSTNLSVAVIRVLDGDLLVRPSLFFAVVGLALVAVAETGRIPVDNPATHLELTMIHEAMVLEYSGRKLALIEWAGAVRLMIFGTLIVNMFVPWGIATDSAPDAILFALLAVGFKLALLGLALGVAETALAKMRLFRVPQFLTLAFVLALLGMLSHVILEVGAA